jgi:hypothetical protein
LWWARHAGHLLDDEEPIPNRQASVTSARLKGKLTTLSRAWDSLLGRMPECRERMDAQDRPQNIH